MNVKQLMELLSTKDQSAEVLVRLDGSIFETDSTVEHLDYNDGSELEFFILAKEDFDES